MPGRRSRRAPRHQRLRQLRAVGERASGPTRSTTDNAAVQALNGARHADRHVHGADRGRHAQLVTVTIHAQNDAAMITGDAAGEVTEAAGSADGPAISTPPTSTMPDDAWHAVAAGAASHQRLRHLSGDGGQACGPTRSTTPMPPCRRSRRRHADRHVHGLTADGTSQLVTVTIHAQNDAGDRSQRRGCRDRGNLHGRWPACSYRRYQCHHHRCRRRANAVRHRRAHRCAGGRHPERRRPVVVRYNVQHRYRRAGPHYGGAARRRVTRRLPRGVAGGHLQQHQRESPRLPAATSRFRSATDRCRAVSRLCRSPSSA